MYNNEWIYLFFKIIDISSYILTNFIPKEFYAIIFLFLRIIFGDRWLDTLNIVTLLSLIVNAVVFYK